VRIKANKCLQCGEKLDAVDKLEGFTLNNKVKPKPGDVSFCISCGYMMMFTRSLGMRHPRADELKLLLGNRNVLVAETAIRELLKRKAH
jgi:hypothetical protein